MEHPVVCSHVIKLKCSTDGRCCLSGRAGGAAAADPPCLGRVTLPALNVSITDGVLPAERWSAHCPAPLVVLLIFGIRKIIIPKGWYDYFTFYAISFESVLGEKEGLRWWYGMGILVVCLKS